LISESDIDYSDFFDRINDGENIRHCDIDPKSDCDQFVSIRNTQTGGIETLGIWCPIHGFLKTGFVGP